MCKQDFYFFGQQELQSGVQGSLKVIVCLEGNIYESGRILIREKKVNSRHWAGLIQLSYLLYHKIFLSSDQRSLKDPAAEKWKISCDILAKTIILGLSNDARSLFFSSRLQ